MQLLNAAEWLGIGQLVELCCAKIATVVMGMLLGDFRQDSRTGYTGVWNNQTIYLSRIIINPGIKLMGPTPLMLPFIMHTHNYISVNPQIITEKTC